MIPNFIELLEKNFLKIPLIGIDAILGQKCPRDGGKKMRKVTLWSCLQGARVPRWEPARGKTRGEPQLKIDRREASVETKATVAIPFARPTSAGPPEMPPPTAPTMRLNMFIENKLNSSLSGLPAARSASRNTYRVRIRHRRTENA